MEQNTSKPNPKLAKRPLTKEENDKRRADAAQKERDERDQRAKDKAVLETQKLLDRYNYVEKKFNMWTDAFRDMDEYKQKQCMDMIDNFDKEMVHFIGIDGGIEQTMLGNLKDGIAAFKIADYNQRYSTLPECSLIICIEKADLCKSYSPQSIIDFEHDDSSYFRKPEYGPIYEVIRDSQPRKPMIIISDVKTDEISTIQGYISEFIQSRHNISEDSAHLVVYSNEANTEFLVSGMMLKNSAEKETFIKAFRSFMRRKDVTIYNKIVDRQDLVREIEGVTYHKLPSSKMIVGDTTVELSDQLLSRPIVININLHDQSIHTHDQSIHTHDQSTVMVGTGNNNNVVYNTVPDMKPGPQFIKHIYDNRPEWYEEGEYVDINIVETAYREYFDDFNISKNVISRNLGGLFKGSKRSSTGGTLRKLAMYADLEALFT